MIRGSYANFYEVIAYNGMANFYNASTILRDWVGRGFVLFCFVVCITSELGGGYAGQLRQFGIFDVFAGIFQHIHGIILQFNIEILI